MLRTKEVSGCGECTPAMDLPGWSAGEFSSRVLGNSAPESQGIQLQNPWEFSSRVPRNSALESLGIQPQIPWEFSPRIPGDAAPQSPGMPSCAQLFPAHCSSAALALVFICSSAAAIQHSRTSKATPNAAVHHLCLPGSSHMAIPVPGTGEPGQASMDSPVQVTPP